jgi:hypothetical protein
VVFSITKVKASHGCLLRKGVLFGAPKFRTANVQLPNSKKSHQAVLFDEKFDCHFFAMMEYKRKYICSDSVLACICFCSSIQGNKSRDQNRHVAMYPSPSSPQLDSTNRLLN